MEKVIPTLQLKALHIVDDQQKENASLSQVIVTFYFLVCCLLITLHCFSPEMILFCVVLIPDF